MSRLMSINVNSHRFKKLVGQSYAEGMILRLKSEHHIPVEQLLTGVVLYRAGISHKGWAHLSQRAILPSKNVIKSFIDRFIERPFLLPYRGRIMLGIYDNLAYKRKFLYQRVGDHTASTINTDYEAHSKRPSLQVNAGDTFYVRSRKEPFVITGRVRVSEQQIAQHVSSHIVARDRCYLYIISCRSSVVQARPHEHCDAEKTKGEC